MWDPEDIGEVVMDKDFSLSSVEAQQSVLDFCSDLKKQDFVLDGNVDCWLKDYFDQWLRSPTIAAQMKKQKQPSYVFTPQDLNGGGSTVPMDGKKFNELLLKFTKEADIGKRLRSDKTLGFIDDKLVFFQVKADSIGTVMISA